MPQERKILVADNDQEFLLSCQYAFSILGMQTIFVPKHGQMLLDAIRKERPDLVICPIFMAYCDAVQIMEKLRADKTAFCQDFIALSSSDNELLFDHFLSSGGAYVFIKPLDSTVLAERVYRYLERQDQKNHLCHLNFSAPPDVSCKAAELLTVIGVPAHLTGYHYLKLGLTLLFENPTRFSYGTKGLYHAIAESTHSSYRCVERNIRTAVEAAFDRGDWEILAKFFGSSISRKTGKPSNVQFIATLYEYLSRKSTVQCVNR